MKKLYYVDDYKFISVYDNSRRVDAAFKELDIAASRRGEYRVRYYILTTPSVELDVCYVE